MKKKYRKRLLLLCILLLIYLLFVTYSNLKTDVVTVPYAAITIPPRTKLDDTMISYKEISFDEIDELIVTDTAQIIGKYNDIQGKIPQGSFFYKEMLIDESNAPDHPSLQLKKDQTSYSLGVDLISSSGNTIIAGQKVDVYISIEEKGTLLKVDCLLKDVRVIDVLDRNGYHIDDEKSSHTPGVILLAVHNEYVNYLKKAEKLGSVEIMASSTNYGDDKECSLNENSIVLKYLQ